MKFLKVMMQIIKHRKSVIYKHKDNIYYRVLYEVKDWDGNTYYCMKNLLDESNVITLPVKLIETAVYKDYANSGRDDEYYFKRILKTVDKH